MPKGTEVIVATVEVFCANARSRAERLCHLTLQVGEKLPNSEDVLQLRCVGDAKHEEKTEIRSFAFDCRVQRGWLSGSLLAYSRRFR